MARLTRRELLRRSLAAAAVAGGGWRTVEALAAAAAQGVPGAKGKDPLAGGRLAGLVPFDNGPAVAFGELIGSGSAGRRRLDLSTLDAASLVTPAGRHFVHTRVPYYLPEPTSWRLGVRHLQGAPLDLTLKELQPLARPQGTHLCECVENGAEHQFGLISAAEWEGVPLLDLIAKVGGGGEEPWGLVVEGFDRHAEVIPNVDQGASWIFFPEDLARTGAFLATAVNGQPIPPELGHPLRLVVPGWYGCTWLKWAYSVVVVPEWSFATPHMKEHAEATFQNGTPRRARNYAPPVVDGAALPVRVEQWEVGKQTLYRVVGIVWGGERPAEALSIRFQPGEDFVPVSGYLRPGSATTWALWTHLWRPPTAGRYGIELRLDQSFTRTRRLASGLYRRTVTLSPPAGRGPG